MSTRVVATLLFFSSACCARSPAPVSSAGAPTDPPVITLERNPCFGTCPVYTVSLSRSGRVTYEGKAHVKQMGAASGQVDQEQVRLLLEDLESVGFFALPDSFTAGSADCGRYHTDAPVVTTTVHRGEESKRVVHDYGCAAAPRKLTELEKRIDEVAGTGRWVK